MRISALATLMILATLFLSACAQNGRAAVDDRGSSYYGRDGKLHKTTAFTPTFGDVEQQESAEIAVVSSNDLAPPSASPMPLVVKPQTPVVAATAAVAVGQPAAEVASQGYQWPVQGRVIQGYGKLANGVVNEGITIEAPEGTPIKAAHAGEVAFIGQNVEGYGKMVIIRHANGDMTSYAHTRTIAVHEGEQVAAGKVIAFVGTSGGVKTPRLHFAIREGDRTVDPLIRLSEQMTAR